MQSQRHIRDFIVDTVSEAKSTGRAHEVCYVKETATYYEFVPWYPHTANDVTILTTGQGGFSRWVAKVGRNRPKDKEIALIIALGS